MPALRTYKVFISHCWEYDANYHRLVEWFTQEPCYRWRNRSVPESKLCRENRRFEARLRKQLGKADVLLVIVGMEIAHRRG